MQASTPKPSENPSDALNLAREAVVERAVNNAALATSNLTRSIEVIRGVEECDSEVNRASLFLDEFVSQARTASEVSSHTTMALDERTAIEAQIKDLNALFVTDVGQIKDKSMSPAYFMQGSEDLFGDIMTRVKSLQTDFVKTRQNDMARQKYSRSNFDAERPQ